MGDADATQPSIGRANGSGNGHGVTEKQRLAAENAQLRAALHRAQMIEIVLTRRACRIIGPNGEHSTLLTTTELKSLDDQDHSINEEPGPDGVRVTVTSKPRSALRLG